MVEKEVDDSRVIIWYHRRFIEVTSSHYISKLNSSERVSIFSNVIDFFNETWKNKPKPFKYNSYIAKKKKLNDTNAAEIRDTSIQKTVVRKEDGTPIYNKRKINELPGFISEMSSDLSLLLGM